MGEGAAVGVDAPEAVPIALPGVGEEIGAEGGVDPVAIGGVDEEIGAELGVDPVAIRGVGVVGIWTGV